MTCQEFWNSMPELEGRTAASGDRWRHAAECPKCAAQLDRQRQLTAGLDALSSSWHQPAAPARVEARLIAAFRTHSGVGAPQRIPTWKPVASWFAAAAGIAALALVLVHGKQPVAPRHPAQSTVEWAAARQSGEPIAADDSQYNSADFIPLPYAAQIAPNEDVNLVRVEVPRSAMIALGYEVSAERASEPVQAEVVLGADGLARAVRFFDEE